MPKPDNNPKVIRKAALALFKDKKVLMARDDHSQTAFYQPGGKIEPGETELDCVVREVKEELDVDLDRNSAILLGHFEAPAHSRKNTVVSIALFTGKINGSPKPNGEIVELQYFDTSVNKKYLTPVTIKKIFPWLKEHGYIN